MSLQLDACGYSSALMMTQQAAVCNVATDDNLRLGRIFSLDGRWRSSLHALTAAKYLSAKLIIILNIHKPKNKITAVCGLPPFQRTPFIQQKGTKRTTKGHLSGRERCPFTISLIINKLHSKQQPAIKTSQNQFQQWYLPEKFVYLHHT